MRKVPGLAGIVVGLGISLGAAAFSSVAASAASAADLRVTVAGIHGSAGRIYVALYDSADAYKAERRRDGVILPITGPEVVAVFANLPPGKYGVAAFHDENGNGKFDKNLLGIPQEGFGFSNDALGHFAPPDFPAMVVPVGTAGVSTKINLRYP
jgi:uncharacterized protein (DUF2141 family)